MEGNVRRKWNFDPNDYSNPNVKPKGSGKGYEDYREMTDYQAAGTLYSFMKNNGLDNSLISTTQVDEAQKTGKITIPGKNAPIDLTAQQRAAFMQLGDNGAALFRRLDQGGGKETGEDQTFAIWDIRNAIKNGGLHSTADVSPYHSDVTSKLNATDSHNGLKDYLGKRYGQDWKEITQSDLLGVADGATDANKSTELAAGWLLKNWSKVAGNDGVLSRQEYEDMKNSI